MAADNALLEAKFEEALSCATGSVDLGGELGMAQDQVRELQKENALLNASLEQSAHNRALPEITALSAANEKLVAENQTLLAQGERREPMRLTRRPRLCGKRTRF